jgi:hypothetical protein
VSITIDGIGTLSNMLSVAGRTDTDAQSGTIAAAGVV